jgi:hypothetical protein
MHGNNPAIRGPRMAFLKAALLNFSFLQILFLALFCYIFGSLYQQGAHVHNLNVLYVDYDGGVVGRSIRDAYQRLQGDTFPSLQERSPALFPTPEDMLEAVCNVKYWGAIYSSPGSSTRLTEALSGGPAATTYNRSDVLTYIWNEARYSAIIDSTISNSLNKLASTARVAYTSRNGTSALERKDLPKLLILECFVGKYTLSIY